MSSLLDRAKTAVPPVTHKWSGKYRAIWFQLLSNGFEPMQAKDWIVENEKLTKAQGVQLYNAATNWKNNK